MKGKLKKYKATVEGVVINGEWCRLWHSYNQETWQLGYNNRVAILSIVEFL